MDSPRSPFMVPSTNSFHKDAKGTKVATRREFDAWNEEPKLPALMRTTKSPTTTPKPMRTPAKPTRRSSPEPYAPCKPAEAKTIRRLAPKAPPTKPLASSPPASKKPLQMVTPPPSEKRLLCRAPSMPTKTPEPEPSTRASPATKAVSLPKTAGIVRRSTPTKQLPTPPPTPPLVLNPRKVAECGPRRQAVHVKIPKPASPAPEKRARSTVTPVLKKVSAKTSDAQKQTETVGHLSANGAASAQEAEGEADRSRATAKVALARGNAVAAPKKYTTVHRPLAKPSSCKTMDKKVAEPQVERSIVRAARPASGGTKKTPSEVPVADLKEIHSPVISQLKDALSGSGGAPARKRSVLMPKKVDMQPIRVMDTRKENVVPSGIQARMAALFDKIEPAQGPAAPAPPAYVRRLKMPELAQGAQASKNAKIQREVEALRSLNRVGNGGQRLLKTKAFGGNGVANRQDREKQQNRYSLECISVIERIKRERTEKA